jgi:hypothetical protein
MALLLAAMLVAVGFAQTANKQLPAGPVPSGGRPLPCVDEHGKLVGRTELVKGRYYFVAKQGWKAAIGPMPASDYPLDGGGPQLCTDMTGKVWGHTEMQAGRWYYVKNDGTKYPMDRSKGTAPQTEPEQGPRQAAPRPQLSPSMEAVPKSHLFAAYYLTDGRGNQEFIDTRGKLIGRVKMRNGVQYIQWNDDAKTGLRRTAKVK